MVGTRASVLGTTHTDQDDPGIAPERAAGRRPSAALSPGIDTLRTASAQTRGRGSDAHPGTGPGRTEEHLL
ncbi:hypothetical protein CCE01nite_17010 [Cellulomonas cellasea]|uniref:Uncharacterized protein n=1 Tax=Cellulomonas cellasea TaxID=43670 RepID=A0A4Y3KUH8_9CELL|nr:hypothetical protein CCE01nite_17010 [Cellulomonas cellasea]